MMLKLIPRTVQYNPLMNVFDSGCSNLIHGLEQKAHIHPDTH